MITCFILSKGSAAMAAAFKCGDIGPETDAITYKMESGDMHFIGKLVFVN